MDVSHGTNTLDTSLSGLSRHTTDVGFRSDLLNGSWKQDRRSPLVDYAKRDSSSITDFSSPTYVLTESGLGWRDWQGRWKSHVEF